ncbi:ATP-binding protein [Sphingosinicella sp. YJ22]|uniref:sensor histidine kinase NtrY-like n=1 Tax=Sphingosinicella sp. YJ22 TaxID=1104780 RepID=UPI0014081AE0|nr:ATP-binding protein [Sphingosinicella sp. YJ22]
MPALEIGGLIVLIATATISYLVISGRASPDKWLDPPIVAALLVANLVPAMAIMVLFARRIAKRRAARLGLGEGRLHVRLVVLFSIIAAIPTLLVVVFASVLFQSSQEFWFSDRWRGSVESAVELTQQAYRGEVTRVESEAVTMATDLVGALQIVEYDDPQFVTFFSTQLLDRNLSEGILLRYTPDTGIQTFVIINPYQRDLERTLDQAVISQLREPLQATTIQEQNRIGVLVRFPGNQNFYLYAARVYGENAGLVPQNAQDEASIRFESIMLDQLRRGDTLRRDFEALTNEARALQFRFNAAILAVSILIVAIAIWVALKLADRLVRPVGALVGAARRISAGDLAARVPQTGADDELRTLGEAFNTMTEQLEEQTGALVTANQQLDSRRAFMEAVLAGVTAGVVSIDQERIIRLANPTAEALLRTSGLSPVGQKLVEVAPELDQLLSDTEAENIVQFASRGEPRTLAVKTVAVEGGHVLTFDDITEQLIDQRRAAWSDVARRIAHEIKNPLTPIQLAAERLQRRYGAEVTSDAATFERLTGTIVRQVGDLRRMVDEFSSFARMPKPVFKAEAVTDIARQALFLHEVAHPGIAFSLDAPEPSPMLVCDRRHLGQALTNIVKNGVEAIEQKNEEDSAGGGDRVAMRVSQDGPRLVIEVEDSGVGLPADRGRITEPYMTTRAKGTGLGLAIVNKIVEEHFGQIEFADAPGGGTLVRLIFDVETLARVGGARNMEEHSVNG